MPRWRFDKAKARRAIDFISRLRQHIGSWAGRPLKLLPWQRKIISDVFGWVDESGKRRYRTVWVEVPRKNGKTTLAAAIALYLLYADEEDGAEIYSAAADREQAAIVFEAARAMVEQAPHLADYSHIYRREILFPRRRNRWKVLSSDASTKHGLNVHGAVIDEVHAHHSRELWDVLVTGTGARRQPLVVAITTAGVAEDGHIAWEMHQYATGVLRGAIKDERFYAAVYSYEGDDWNKPRAWRKANPSYGHTVTREYLEAAAKAASRSPAAVDVFRQLHLNVWRRQHYATWLSLDDWDACKSEIDWSSYRGRECYAGLDLSAVRDLTALCLLFPEPWGGYTARWRYWCPSETIYERSRRDRVPYDQWAARGWLCPTAGNCVDYDRVRHDILEFARQYRIVEVAIDRYFQGLQLAGQLMDDGLDVVSFGQGYLSMSGPAKEFERLVLGRLLRHEGDPVTRWAAQHCVAESDPAGNIKPSKRRSREKIDGIVACVMALGRAMIRDPGGGGQSVYEERGILAV